MIRGFVTLCGSHRFKDDFEYVAQELGCAGWVVLRPAFHVDAHLLADPVGEKVSVKGRLDAIHKEKIAMSQAIVVISRDGYVGESTRSEIEYARLLEKKVYWFEFPLFIKQFRDVIDPDACLFRVMDSSWDDLLLTHPKLLAKEVV